MKRHRTASSQDEMLHIEDLNLIAESLDIRKTKGKMVTSTLTPRSLKEIDRIPSFSEHYSKMVELTQIKHPSLPKSFSSTILINLLSLTVSLSFWYIGLFKSFLCHLLFFLYIPCEDNSKNNEFSFRIIGLYNVRYLVGLILSYYSDNDMGRILDHIVFLIILNNDFIYIKFNNLLIINTLCTVQYSVLQLYISLSSHSFLLVIMSIIIVSYLLTHNYIHNINNNQIINLKQVTERIANDYEKLKVYSNTQKSFINQLVPPHFSSSVRKQLIKKSLNNVQSEINPLIIGISDNYENVTVIFTDVVGFTKYSSSHSPIEIVELLDRLFYFMDILCNKHGLYKVKTIGDAYMAVNGLNNNNNNKMSVYDICSKTADFALDVLHFMKDYKPMSDNNMLIRIGINIGPLVGGIIEMKRLIFDVFGDTVNLASRMESNGIPGSIQCSYSFYNILCSNYVFSYRGKIEMKGKGLTDCYILESKLKSPHRTMLRSFSSQSARNMSISSSSSNNTPVEDNNNLQETVMEFDDEDIE